MKPLMKAAFALLALAMVSTGCLVEEHPSVTDDLPDAPEFDLVALNGGTVDSGDLKGKVVVLDFWATWCSPCIEEIPNYNALFAEQDPDRFAIIGITVESGPIEDVRPYVAEFGIDYPVVMGDAEVIAAFGNVNSFPMTFVISPDWKVFKKYIGQFPPNKKEQIEADILELTGNSS